MGKLTGVLAYRGSGLWLARDVLAEGVERLGCSHTGLSLGESSLASKDTKIVRNADLDDVLVTGRSGDQARATPAGRSPP